MSIGKNTRNLNERALCVMPGRQSNFRAVPGVDPFFLDSANNLRYTDVDGREFVDFILAMGAAIWGYGDQEYKKALHDQIEHLLAISSGAAQTALEVDLAEAIVERVPCAEWVRFGISGSEAVQLALRLGRAYTGRPYFLRFAGHYHGWLDNVAGGIPPAQQAAMPFPIHSDDDPGRTEGRSPYAFQESLMIPWNDADRLEDVLKHHGDKIAVVMMEAIMCNYGCCPPRPGYLERVRELCDQYGCVLFFDEVITGFRVAPGGAQELLGVTPDLCTFGKALAGGLPLSAIAGKQNILQKLRDNTVLGGGTFNAFPLGMAAGVATMRMFAKDNGAAYRRMDEVQQKLNDGLRSIADKYAQPLLIQGPRGLIHINFIDREQAWSPADLQDSDTNKSAHFSKLLLENGVLMGGGNRWFISPNHTDADIEMALAAVDHAMAQL